MDDKKMPKNANKFCCECCNFLCSKQSNYTVHLMTAKHGKQEKRYKMISTDDNKMPKNAEKYICNCGKKYKHYSGLWRHHKICSFVMEEIKKEDKKENQEKNEIKILTTLITDLVKTNNELQNQMLEVIKHGTTINNTNSHNKTFNLQFFLNETCKDAMNIMDFVDSIKLTLSDLEKVGQIGYVEGISNIITTNLKALDVTQRPIHCTDTKREILYVKDENKWEKEAEKKDKIRKAIKCVANKNIRMLPKFKEIHPDCVKSESNYSDQYNTLMVESFGGSGNNDLEKENKIIKKISKEIIVDR